MYRVIRIFYIQAQNLGVVRATLKHFKEGGILMIHTVGVGKPKYKCKYNMPYIIIVHRHYYNMMIIPNKYSTRKKENEEKHRDRGDTHSI